MRQKRYTPGPWRAIHNDEGTVIVGPRHEPGRFFQFIAVPYAGLTESLDDNAHLIAAAPELLEALEAAVECGMVPASSAKDGGATKHARPVQVADQIRAAIAKAYGEEEA